MISKIDNNHHIILLIPFHTLHQSIVRFRFQFDNGNMDQIDFLTMQSIIDVLPNQTELLPEWAMLFAFIDSRHSLKSARMKMSSRNCGHH